MSKRRFISVLDSVRMFGVHTILETVQYHRIKQRQDARFGIPKQDVGPWQMPGKLRAFEPDAQGVTFHGEMGSLRIDVLAEGCLRVRARPDGMFLAPFSYAVAKTAWPPVMFSVSEGDDAMMIRAGETCCCIARDTLKLAITFGGQTVMEDMDGPAWRGDDVRLSLRMTPDESGHALGERAFGFNLRGRIYRFWNTDPSCYDPGEDPINLCIPFYVGLRETGAYGVFWDNSSRGAVAVGAPDAPDALVFSAEFGELRYYVFTGPTALDVLERYTELTGRMALPPLWALGYHQSRWSYLSDAEVRGIAREFRRRHIPCDAIYFDIDYMDGFRCFTWDRRRFPNPPGLIADLEQDGFKAVTILDPGIKVDPKGYAVCRSGLEKGMFLKYPDGSLFVAPVWPGNCYFPDFTSPAVRDWWGQWYAGLVADGVAGFWNDMAEPAIFGVEAGKSAEAPDYLVHDWEGQGATHLEAHNVYGMLMGRATREGLERLRPDKRQLVIIRAGYAGAQRYASSWTADNASTWDHLRLSIPMCLNLGLSGLAFTGPDVGGFAGNASGELFARWVQVAALLPFFRGHSAAGTQRHEPWSFGQPYEDVARRAIELRYRLLPYLYTVFAQCAEHGWPIVRPLALLDHALADCDDEYLLGDTLLVAPVVIEGATTRVVRFPAGLWYDYWSGTMYQGPAEAVVAAPLDVLPLFVRAGSVLPHWPLMQYTGEHPIDELLLRIYAGNGESTLYEDAGETLTYREGEFRWSRFACVQKMPGVLEVVWSRSGEFRPAYSRVKLEIVGLVSPPRSLLIDGQPVSDWRFENGVLVLATPMFGNLSYNSAH